MVKLLLLAHAKVQLKLSTDRPLMPERATHILDIGTRDYIIRHLSNFI